MSIDVSVQVCTFNRRETVLRCVEALSKVVFDPSRFELVVVDDGSSDGSAAAIEAAGMPCRLVVLTPAHAGLASARNVGIRAAIGEVVLFVDDDTLAHPALLQEHWRTHLAHPRAVVAGAVRHVPSPGTPAGRARLSDYSTSFFWTTNVSARRLDLLDAGLFDEDFTEYGWEDLEFGDRLRARGLVRRRNARALVRHVKPAPTRGDLPRMLARAEASGRIRRRVRDQTAHVEGQARDGPHASPAVVLSRAGGMGTAAGQPRGTGARGPLDRNPAPRGGRVVRHRVLSFGRARGQGVARTTMTPQISLVVPTRNRCDTLQQVLPTLLAQTCDPARYEVLLCDYGSDDGTRELVASIGASNVRVVDVRVPGRAGGRNAGVRLARGHIILFTDADILADPSLVDEHLVAHARHPGAAVVGWEVRVDSLDEYRAVKGRPAARRRLHPPWKRRLSWPFFVTGNASARRDDLVRVGLFDESMTEYGHEDLELGYRLQRAGVPIVHHPAAVNFHWHPESLEARSTKMYLSGRATLRMYRTHRDWRILAWLGVNPFSLAWHAALRRDGPVLRRCRASAEASAWCRSLVLEHAYLAGVKDALAGRASRDPIRDTTVR